MQITNIAQILNQMTFDSSIIWLNSVDSTNTETYRQSDTLDNLSVIAAYKQTKGKGQRGNKWFTEEGTNLTFSLLLKFGEGALSMLNATKQFCISEAVTCALAEYFEQEGIEVKIKWPNDIYHKDKKLVGILIENSLNGQNLSKSIVGIGINCNQKTFPPELPNPTSMTLINGVKYDLHPTLEKICKFLCKYLQIMENEEGRKALHLKFIQSLYRLNEWHNYVDISEGITIKGKIKGISESALLQIEMPDGILKEYAFKEIAYIL